MTSRRTRQAPKVVTAETDEHKITRMAKQVGWLDKYIKELRGQLHVAECRAADALKAFQHANERADCIQEQKRFLAYEIRRMLKESYCPPHITEELHMLLGKAGCN